jgi:2-phosphosulfolactate phosphatase
MSTSLEVLFTPADFEQLPERDLSNTTCVVFDILRATSSMITALSNGAKEIIPVATIEEALALRRKTPDVLLAGERHGVRIRADQTSGIDFDFGNSPREFTCDRVRGRTIVVTTTNGTRALRSCLAARNVLIGSFLGLGAIVRWIEREKPDNLLLICSGTYEQASYEDTLAAGALSELIWHSYELGSLSDSAAIAREIYRIAKGDLLNAIPHARNGRRLLSDPELCGDVPFSLQRDTVSFIAHLGRDGVVRRTD